LIGDKEKAAQFVQLLAASERNLARYVLALVPNFVDSDEILQETKLRLWEQFEEYDPQKNFGAWARAVAYYQVSTFRKTRGRGKVVFSTDFVATLADEVANRDDEASDRSDALILCLKQLSPKYQALLREFYSRLSTLEHVAKAVGMTVVAARKALVRSRQALHKCIELRLLREKA